MSVRELLGQLAAIGEIVLLYPSADGRPRARRMTTELTADQSEPHRIFGLQRWAPASLGHTPKQPLAIASPAETITEAMIIGYSGWGSRV